MLSRPESHYVSHSLMGNPSGLPIFSSGKDKPLSFGLQTPAWSVSHSPLGLIWCHKPCRTFTSSHFGLFLCCCFFVLFVFYFHVLFHHRAFVAAVCSSSSCCFIIFHDTSSEVNCPKYSSNTNILVTQIYLSLLAYCNYTFLCVAN